MQLQTLHMQLRSPTTTFLGFADDVLDSDADPLVGHHALAFFQHAIDERLGVISSPTPTRAACSPSPTSTSR